MSSLGGIVVLFVAMESFNTTAIIQHLFITLAVNALLKLENIQFD